MIVACAFDHAGYPLRDRLLPLVRELGHEVLDLGTDAPSPPVDYPDKALAVGHAVVSGEAERGIIVCGYTQPASGLRQDFVARFTGPA